MPISWRSSLSLPLLLSAMSLVVLTVSCRQKDVPVATKSTSPEVKSIPNPPQQGAAWTCPETKLPPELVRACEELFTAGFADPRGCEYREITLGNQLPAGEMFPQPTTMQTEGWLLPSTPGETRRFAVCWDGLVYPVIAVGKPVELNEAITKLENALDPKWSQDPMRNSKIGASNRDQLTLAKVAMLLRLGQVDAAEKLWQRWVTFVQTGLDKDDLAQPFDPFTVLFRDWLWADFHRAQLAHQTGDAALALAYLNQLSDFQARALDLAKQRGIEPAGWYRQNGHAFDVTFLQQLPGLMDDEKRRVRENVIDRDEELNPDSIADKKQRIALLIRDLQNIDAHPMMSPGYTYFDSSLTVTELIQQGEDAVDPLIECLAHDKRLTRSIDNGSRNIWANGYPRVIGVEEPAFAALQGILHTHEEFGWLKEPYVNGYPGGILLDRVALAAQIQNYWNSIKGKSLPERWYVALQDDHAEPDAWAEAAENIVLPCDQDLFAGYGRIRMMFNPERSHDRMWGEELRSKAAPSVSELLVKRLHDSMAQRARKNFFPLNAPKKLAKALAKWDGKNQIEALRWYSGELQKIVATEIESNGPGEIDDLVKTYLARVEAGDPVALSEYAQWIQSAQWVQKDRAKTLIDLDHMYGPFFFSPLWSYPDDPAMISLAKWLFENPKSPWSIGKSGTDPTWVANSTHSSLVALPLFRALLIEQLKNKKVVGDVTITAPNLVMVTFVYGHGAPSNDPDLPPPGKMDLRLCDYIASRFSTIRGAPRCEPYWTTEQKDAAIQKTISFLQQYGDRLSHRTLSTDDFFGPLDQSPTFPQLDHPATREDVKAGRAIFSMEGKGECKLVPLPETPMRGKWITLKDYPTTQDIGPQSLVSAGSKIKGYDQDVTIWQAEDVLIDGKWQRYYGVIGKNCLAAVSGEEIRLEGMAYPDEANDGWGFRTLVLQKKGDSSKWIQRERGKIGDALPVTVSVENLNGTGRTFPVQHAPGTVNAGELGLEILIEYNPRPMAKAFVWPPRPKNEWSTIQPKAPLQVELLSLPNPMPPIEKAALLQFDLTHAYDLKSPGTYRMKLTLKKGALFNSDRTLNSEYFELTK